jgi:radical SAM protein with 4Fe4S-binding SPASM domain
LKDDWAEIYNNELAKEIREHRYAPAKCRECPDVEICGAGCPLAVKYDKVFCCPDAASNPV